jgi:antitoxin ParD1/3/4
MATLNITLPDPMKEFVEAQAQREGFGTVSEYLGSMIRETQMRQAKRELEAKLREGIESGPATPMTTEDWDSIREEVHRRHAERQGHANGQG